VAQVHVIANQKGGVGKTTITVNLAAVTNDVLRPSGAAALGDDQPCPVLVVSTDPQASTVWWAERVTDPPFDFTQAHDDPHGLKKLRELEQYQHVFVDTPGSLEDERILAAALEYADDVLVPMTPEPLAFDPTIRTVEKVLRPKGKKFVIVVNAWDPRDGRSDLDQTLEFIAANGWPCANTVVRRYKLHTRAAADGTVVTQYPRNRTAAEAREDFLRLALEQGYGGNADAGRVGVGG
jgi:chromosome partitioning protein